MLKWFYRSTLPQKTVTRKALPTAVNKNLLNYVKAKQNLVDDHICEIFIDQIVQEVCYQANVSKIEFYKVIKEVSSVETDEKFIKIDGKRCIVINLETSPELGEAYPSYLGSLDENDSVFLTEANYNLKDGDAYYFEGDNLAIFKQSTGASAGA